LPPNAASRPPSARAYPAQPIEETPARPLRPLSPLRTRLHPRAPAIGR
jgi:hypothetical protein